MIYGRVAITMRQSDYHIDRLPDGLSALITSWPVDKYLFEMQRGGGGGGARWCWCAAQRAEAKLPEIFPSISDLLLPQTRIVLRLFPGGSVLSDASSNEMGVKSSR